MRMAGALPGLKVILMNPSVPNSPSQGQSHVDPAVFAAELITPAAGARVVTLLSGGPPLGQVWLAPGSGLNRHDRQQIVSVHPQVCCAIRGEPALPWQEAPRPADFHGATLRWMLKSANYIAIWSVPFPQLAAECEAAGAQAVKDGATFTVLIETTAHAAAEWAALARRLKRKAAQLDFFGPEHGRTVQ
jgi:hypothetical protein